jgi:hypothetical protein
MGAIPFLLPLAFGIAIGATATLAWTHRDALVAWLEDLWDDDPGRDLPAPWRLQVLDGGHTPRRSTSGHCTLRRPPFQFDDRLDGGGAG